MALGRWLDAAEVDDDGEATAARPLVTVPIERRELGGRRAQHPAWRIPPHCSFSFFFANDGARGSAPTLLPALGERSQLRGRRAQHPIATDEERPPGALLDP